MSLMVLANELEWERRENEKLGRLLGLRLHVWSVMLLTSSREEAKMKAERMRSS